MPEQRKRRLPRNTLTRSLIVATALDLLDRDESAGLTFTQLGAALGATPPAVFRHFRNREELLLAITEELIREAFEGFKPSGDWLATLRDIAERTWSMGDAHPAATALTMISHTGGGNELAVVDAILGAVLRGGWSGHEAVLEYRAFADFILAVTTAHAGRNVAERVEGRMPMWIQEYEGATPENFPSAAALQDELRKVDLREVLEHQLDVYLAAMQSRSPGGTS